jgi:hypothetical protein
MLQQLGVEDERVQIVWASASEGIVLAEAVNRMTEQVRALGPLNWEERVLKAGNGYQPSVPVGTKEELAEVLDD